MKQRDARGRFSKGKAATRYTVRDRDRGYARVLRNVRTAGDTELTVGLHQEQGARAKQRPAGARAPKRARTVVEVLSYHEFAGANSRLPRRSVVLGWADENQQRNAKLLRAMATKVLQARVDPDRAMQLLGLDFQGGMRARMSKGIPPGLAASTLARKTVGGKSGTTPLINTGQTRAALTFAVARATKRARG